MRRIVRALPLVAGAAGGAALAAVAFVAGYRWAEPRIADRVGGGHR